MKIKGDSFWYVLETHHSDINHKDYIKYEVFEYYNDLKHSYCFDPELMFNTKSEAEDKALELNKKLKRDLCK